MRYLLQTLIVILLLPATMRAQTYLFPIYFEDGVGNKDTLYFGFDEQATYGIDSIFGENNIIEDSISGEFELRFSDEHFSGANMNEIGGATYNSKKQVLPIYGSEGDGYSFVNEVDVFCSNWPITISWDSVLFETGFLSGVLITTWHDPRSWFDVGAISGESSYHFLRERSSIWYAEEQLADLSDGTLPFFYIGWYDVIGGVGGNKNNFTTITPNPITNFFQVTDKRQVSKIDIFDMFGNLILQNEGKEKTIMTDGLMPGQYSTVVSFTNGEKATHKLIKQ